MTAAAHARRAVDEATTAMEALHRLNSHVLQTGGASTAILAIIRPLRVEIASVGDGEAYVLGADGRVAALSPQDRASPNRLVDHLGWTGLRGHAGDWQAPEAVLLCTDGVNDVVGADELGRAIVGAGNQMAGLAKAVMEAGCPDDATALLARRSR
ncbi:MAG: protein phosphatase 2C domain-containing protein [Thermoplasmatota archaeon]